MSLIEEIKSEIWSEAEKYYKKFRESELELAKQYELGFANGCARCLEIVEEFRKEVEG